MPSGPRGEGLTPEVFCGSKSEAQALGREKLG